MKSCFLALHAHLFESAWDVSEMLAGTYISYIKLIKPSLEICPDYFARMTTLLMNNHVTIMNLNARKMPRNSRRRFNPYSAGIDFSRQNLTSVDVRF